MIKPIISEPDFNRAIHEIELLRKTLVDLSFHVRHKDTDLNNKIRELHVNLVSTKLELERKYHGWSDETHRQQVEDMANYPFIYFEEMGK